jgi:hypothetical protein
MCDGYARALTVDATVVFRSFESCINATTAAIPNSPGRGVRPLLKLIRIETIVSAITTL